MLQLITDYNILKIAQELSKLGYWSLDLGTGKITWSPEVYHMYGRDMSLPGPSLNEFYSYIHPEDTQILVNAMVSALRDEAPYCIVHRIVKQDNGEVAYYQSRGDVVKNRAGQVIRFIGTVLDISDQILLQKQLETSYLLFKNIINELNFPIVVKDDSFRFVMVNHAYTELMGINAERAIGKTLHEIDYFDPNNGLVERDHEVLNSDASIEFEYDLHHPKTGKTRHLVVNKFCVISQGQKLIVTSLKDITSAKDNALLKMATKQAELANKIKSEFIANISHEIRNPLNALVGAAELLLESPAIVGDDLDYINIIQDSSNLILKLINDVLDLSKIEAGKLELYLGEFDLYESIISIINVSKISAQKKNLALILDYDITSVPRHIIGDHNKVVQILQNLVSNAVKFTHEGFVAIKVSNQGNKFFISVKDSGIGICPQQQDNIFDKFVQANNSISSQYGGTGLGLSISLKLAQLMGGNIELTSHVGQGSTFTLAIEFEVVKSIAESDLCTAHENKFAFHIPTILLVEDNTNNRKVMLGILEKFALKVEEASNGQEATEIFKHKAIDLILMDCKMPTMDGYTASIIIKDMIRSRKRKDTPIIAITAYASKQDKEKCLEYGMNDYLTKPVNVQKLSDKLVKWLGRENVVKA